MRRSAAGLSHIRDPGFASPPRDGFALRRLCLCRLYRRDARILEHSGRLFDPQDRSHLEQVCAGTARLSPHRESLLDRREHALRGPNRNGCVTRRGKASAPAPTRPQVAEEPAVTATAGGHAFPEQGSRAALQEERATASRSRLMPAAYSSSSRFQTIAYTQSAAPSRPGRTIAYVLIINR